MSVASGRDAASAWQRVAGSTLLVVAALARVAVVFRRGLDPDESQHLHAAWRVAQGLVPHRDFWEHHLALFYYLLAPVTWLFAESPAVYPGARALMVAFGAAALLLTHRLARRAGPGAGSLALALLLVSPEFTDLTTETRPDVPALVAWLGLLHALVRWRTGRGPGWLFGAGLAQGAMTALTTKALFVLPGVAVVLAIEAISAPAARPGRPVARTLAAAGTVFGAGALVVPGLLLGILAATGGRAALAALVQQVIRDNLAFVDFAKTGPAGDASLAFLVAGLLGAAGVAGTHGRRLLAHPVHGTLLLPAVSLGLCLALPGVPAVYGHAWLPLWPILAIYAGLAGTWLVAWARGGPAARPGRVIVAATAAILVLGVPAANTLVHHVLPDRAGPQRALVRRLLLQACPGEPVLDGIALAVFRPSAYRHGVLVVGVREWIARGVMAEEEVEADLRRARAPVAVTDRRIRGLIGPVAQFLERHYVRLDGELLVVGAAAVTDGGPRGGRAYAELLRGGPYRLEAAPGIRVAIDRVVTSPGWVTLTAGRHELTWTGGPGPIRLLLGTCAERGGPGGSPSP